MRYSTVICELASEQGSSAGQVLVRGCRLDQAVWQSPAMDRMQLTVWKQLGARAGRE